MTKLVAILAMVSMTGCSLFLTRGPGDSTVTTGSAAVQKAPPDCTSSMTWPTIDGVVAGVITLALIAGISSKNEADRPDSDAVTGGFIVAGTAGVSALIGHGRVTRCRRATETYTAQTYGPTPGYGYQGYAYPQQYPQGQYPQGQYPQQYPQGYTYPQQYPAPQQYPTPAPPAPQQYPAPQPPAPAQNTTKVPPVPLNPPIPKQPPPKPPAPKQPPPPPKPPDPILGTEGDVCTGQADCGAGLSCTGNVCVKK